MRPISTNECRQLFVKQEKETRQLLQTILSSQMNSAVLALQHVDIRQVGYQTSPTPSPSPYHWSPTPFPSPSHWPVRHSNHMPTDFNLNVHLAASIPSPMDPPHQNFLPSLSTYQSGYSYPRVLDRRGNLAFTFPPASPDTAQSAGITQYQSVQASSQPLSEDIPVLVIPKVPRGSETAWEQVIRDWDHPDPSRFLTIAMSEWTEEWINANNVRSHYNQRSLIAIEYIEE